MLRRSWWSIGRRKTTNWRGIMVHSMRTWSSRRVHAPPFIFLMDSTSLRRSSCVKCPRPVERRKSSFGIRFITAENSGSDVELILLRWKTFKIKSIVLYYFLFRFSSVPTLEYCTISKPFHNLVLDT